MEILEWAVVRGDVDSLGPAKRGLGREPLAHDPETDDLIGVIDIAVAFDHARANPPRQKVRIPFHIGGKVEKLLGRIRQHAFYPVARHDRMFPSDTCRPVGSAGMRSPAPVGRYTGKAGRVLPQAAAVVGTDACAQNTSAVNSLCTRFCSASIAFRESTRMSFSRSDRRSGWT